MDLVLVYNEKLGQFYHKAQKLLICNEFNENKLVLGPNIL